MQHPKWIIGYSDITVMHNKLHELGYQSIHAQMPVDYVAGDGLKGSPIRPGTALIYADLNLTPIGRRIGKILLETQQYLLGGRIRSGQIHLRADQTAVRTVRIVAIEYRAHAVNTAGTFGRPNNSRETELPNVIG